MEYFIARYEKNGVKRSNRFNKAVYDEAKATEWLQSQGVQNFFFFFEPVEPIEISDSEVMFSGEVGFDITLERLIPYIKSDHKIIINSSGGSLWEAYAIHDTVTRMGKTLEIGVIGLSASAATIFSLMTPNSWGAENSRYMIHNPWIFDVGDADYMAKKAKELNDENDTLANMYANYLGKNTPEFFRSLMNEERVLTAEEAFEIGLIAKINRSKTEYQLKKEKMDEKLTEKLSGIESVLAKVLDFIKPKTPKSLTVSDANGRVIDFPDIEEESQIAVGDNATIDGVAADGEVLIAGGLHDGKTFVFEAGTLIEMKEPEAEPTETEKEVARLKEELTTAKDFKTKAEIYLKDLSAKVAEFRAMVTDGTPAENTPPAIKLEGKKGFTYKQ